MATLLFHQAFITFFERSWLSQLIQRPLTAIVLIVIRCREIRTLKYVRKRFSLHYYYDSMQNLLIIEPLRAIHKTLNIFLLKFEIMPRDVHHRKSSMVDQVNIRICLWFVAQAYVGFWKTLMQYYFRSLISIAVQIFNFWIWKAFRMRSEIFDPEIEFTL